MSQRRRKDRFFHAFRLTAFAVLLSAAANAAHAQTDVTAFQACYAEMVTPLDVDLHGLDRTLRALEKRANETAAEHKSRNIGDGRDELAKRLSILKEQLTEAEKRCAELDRQKNAAIALCEHGLKDGK